MNLRHAAWTIVMVGFLVLLGWAVWKFFMAAASVGSD